MMKMLVCRVENEFPNLDLGRTTFMPYNQTYLIFLLLQRETRGSKFTAIKLGSTEKQPVCW